jgi:hypothetical protein
MDTTERHQPRPDAERFQARQLRRQPTDEDILNWKDQG